MMTDDRTGLLVSAQILALRAMVHRDREALEAAWAIVPNDLTDSEWWGMQAVMLEVVCSLLPPVPDGGFLRVVKSDDARPGVVLLGQVVAKWATTDKTDRADAHTLVMVAADDDLRADFGAELILLAASLIRHKEGQ
jgi:hypothetical protein